MGLNFPYMGRYNSACSSRGELRGPHVSLEGDDILVLYSCNFSIYVYSCHLLPNCTLSHISFIGNYQQET